MNEKKRQEAWDKDQKRFNQLIDDSKIDSVQMDTKKTIEKYNLKNRKDIVALNKMGIWFEKPIDLAIRRILRNNKIRTKP